MKAAYPGLRVVSRLAYLSFPGEALSPLHE